MATRQHAGRRLRRTEDRGHAAAHGRGRRHRRRRALLLPPRSADPVRPRGSAARRRPARAAGASTPRRGRRARLPERARAPAVARDRRRAGPATCPGGRAAHGARAHARLRAAARRTPLRGAATDASTNRSSCRSTTSARPAAPARARRSNRPCVTGARRFLEPAPAAPIPTSRSSTPVSRLPEQLGAAPELEDAVRRDAANPRFPDDLDTLYEPGKAPRCAPSPARHVHRRPRAPRRARPGDQPLRRARPRRHRQRHRHRTGMLACHVAPDVGAGRVAVARRLHLRRRPPPALQHVIDRLPRTTVVVALGRQRRRLASLLPRRARARRRRRGVRRPRRRRTPGALEQLLGRGSTCAPRGGSALDLRRGTYETSTGSVETFDDPTPSARWSGTSFAAPLVAAEIARRVKEDADTGTVDTAVRSAHRRPGVARPAGRARPLNADRPAGLVYWPPVDPRTPRLP